MKALEAKRCEIIWSYQKKMIQTFTDFILNLRLMTAWFSPPPYTPSHVQKRPVQLGHHLMGQCVPEISWKEVADSTELGTEVSLKKDLASSGLA